MGRSIWLLFQFLCYLLQYQVASSSSSSSTHDHLCPHDQMFALLQFKNMLTIDNSTSSGWWFHFSGITSYPKTASWNESSNTDCCSWDGITCDGLTGHVIGLDLSCSQLSGTIHPNSSLFRLSHLQRLNLAYNDFNHSRISSEFGRFASLTHLNLSNSQFSGFIPLEISHLSKLVSLSIDSTIGSTLRLEPHNFKMMLKNLTQLQHLILSHVNISSILPNSLMNLSSLMTLDLRVTGLQGNLPDNIFQLPKLEELDLSENIELTGAFPKVNWSSGNSLRTLYLGSTGLSGELPNSIGHLKSLNYLDLSSCKFSGSIPRSVGNLSQIRELDLSSNSFNGQFPFPLSNLKQLTFLSLGRINLEGQIPNIFAELEGPLPSNISGLQNLQVLDLYGNFLNGKIPYWLLTLSSLVYLDLSYNQLTGQIPEFQHASPLESLYLQNNKLYGPIPPSITNLVNLTDLFLSSNNLTGVVELHIFSNLTNLESLSLSDNSLSVSIGSNTNFTLPLLHSLFLSSCNIKEFPNFLQNSTYLQRLDLDLSNNNIQGKIPKWVMEGSFNLLDLSHNNLHGPVPHINAMGLFISYNKLTGYIPSSICSLTILEILVLSHNNLSGAIPQCLGDFSSLSVIDLRMNGLNGTIPTTFAEGNWLQTLNLNGNQLEGSLPRALANCRYMEVLDLGRNKLNDTFPYWLDSLPQLQVLVLQYNKFYGPIHISRTEVPFPNLRIVDLSHNQFSGPLPGRYLQNFEAMRIVDETTRYSSYLGFNYYQDSVEIVLKGVEFELVRILTVFTTIDFSCNQFQGEIPNVISTLHSLRLLNISHNSLAGHVPSSLANLTLLESLDLSSNQLTGEIPQQLASLTFLAMLNFSRNHLVGPIPRSRQFDTFENSSYDGNLALCGFPLSKKCGEDEAPQHQPQPMLQLEVDSDFFNGFTWKAVVMGYGCGMVFGLVVGYLIFLTRKPKWFIRVAEEELLRKARRSKKIGHRRGGRRN